MNHHDVRARLSEYLEGELSLRQRALVDAHLDACSVCREELGELRVTVRLLRGFEDAAPRTAIADAVMDRIRAGEGAPSWWSRLTAQLEELTQPRVVRPLVVCALGLAALLVVRPEIMNVWRSPVGAPPQAVRARAPGLSDLPVASAPAPRAVGRALGAPSADVVAERPPVRRVWRHVGTGGSLEFRGDPVYRHVRPLLSRVPVVNEAPPFPSPGWPLMMGPDPGAGFPSVRTVSGGR